MPNPVYRDIQLMLRETESEIAALSVRREAYIRRAEQLAAQTEMFTAVEEKLQSLAQEHDTAKGKYDTLIGRQESATLAGDIEQTGEDVRFRLIDPPRVLEAWSSIARKQFIFSSVVLLAALGCGIGVAFLLAQLSPVVYGQRGLSELTEVPVFGTISNTLTRPMQAYHRLGLVSFVLCGFLLVGAYGSVVFLQYRNVDITQLPPLSYVKEAIRGKSEGAPPRTSPQPANNAVSVPSAFRALPNTIGEGWS